MSGPIHLGGLVLRALRWPDGGMSRDPEPDDVDGPDPVQWYSAAETIRRVRKATLSPQAEVDIARRALAGLLRARACLMITNSQQRDRDLPVPAAFWWAEGFSALTQQWELGDFETYMPKTRVRVQIFGVEFHGGDLENMVPGEFPAQRAIPDQSSNSGGRPRSDAWPEWVAELVAMLYLNEIPGGVESLKADPLASLIADRLARRDIEAPPRSTVLPTVRKVLQRLRDEN